MPGTAEGMDAWLGPSRITYGLPLCCLEEFKEGMLIDFPIDESIIGSGTACMEKDHGCQGTVSFFSS